MGDFLKNLLRDAVQRSGAVGQVQCAQAVAVAQEALIRLLPHGRSGDARAVSLRDGTLLLECESGAVAQFLHERKNVMMEAMSGQFGSDACVRVRIRIRGRQRDDDL